MHLHGRVVNHFHLGKPCSYFTSAVGGVLIGDDDAVGPGGAVGEECLEHPGLVADGGDDYQFGPNFVRSICHKARRD